MKKILLLIVVVFFLSGCSFYNAQNISIDEIMDTVPYEEINLFNTNNKGYRYYLPRSFVIYENNLANQTLMSNNDKYYLNIDLVAYYNKTDLTHTNNDHSYYYKTWNAFDKTGYIKINQKKDYFFIEIMYNYAIIEVMVEEDNINYAIINMLNILKSIKYNDNVIKNEIGENILTQKETKYELEEPKNNVDSKNFLDYMEEYGTYESSSLPKDTDVIGE